MSTSLCPAVDNTAHPIGCTMFDHDCVDDPDLECEWFIGYLHNVLFGDKRVYRVTAAEMPQQNLPFGGADEVGDTWNGPGGRIK
ncbi:hypothetical protein LCGC14_1600160 [marine sediment metagenome]|uniref:Uncharacterized protein n=1 Tax=marine sediment metagenome TaxID=412755 RepID=A0A0F9IBP7_9ZZZZ